MRAHLYSSARQRASAHADVTHTNDRVVSVPVLTGIAFGNKPRQTAITVLDNEPLPVVLDYSVLAGRCRIRCTKISFPSDGELEKHLAVDKHVDVYGIYFDFASDRLRPESTPVLEEIAGALTKNSSWRLSIAVTRTTSAATRRTSRSLAGGSDAVRTALVERFHIDGARLATTGYGASQPKDSNTTPEGRSKNWRVELVRL